MLEDQQLRVLLEKGDLRQSINSLQSFQRLANIPPELLPLGENFGDDIVRQLSSCHDIKEVIQIGDDLKYEGYACDEVLNGLTKAVLNRSIHERKKAMML
jgi:DNA polymerase III delta prime subunit